MWGGELEVVLTDGTMLIFQLWHHFHDNDGDDWKPSPEELANAWDIKFVAVDKSEKNLQSSAWHLFLVNGHYYVSKIGTFANARPQDKLIESIKDGSWKGDPDIWCLV